MSELTITLERVDCDLGGLLHYVDRVILGRQEFSASSFEQTQWSATLSNPSITAFQSAVFLFRENGNIEAVKQIGTDKMQRAVTTRNIADGQRVNLKNEKLC